MIYTQEQWNVIKQASPHYLSAKKDYVRNAPRWLTQQVIDTYEAATGKTIPYKDLACAVCVLRVYQLIGKTYFDDLKYHQEKTQQVENEETTNRKPINRDKEKASRDNRSDKKGKTKVKDNKRANKKI